MQYNLVRNGYFTALTASGTGDVSLTWDQLESLMDGNLTSSGVAITSSGVLYLQVDLSQRIKIDDIKLYASDLTKSANIKFYYKNEESDNYTELTTQSGSYYYAEISDPSAPRFVRATVSGINVELYELVIYNDDYIVAFGTDGQLYADYIDDSPIGSEGDSQAVPIYNNRSAGLPATGYAVIDYTGTSADDYIKISASENGTYYSISDGALLKGNDLSSTYIWDMGTYNNIIAVGDSIEIDAPTLSGGVYISPIFKMNNGYESSYFTIDVDTTSGVTSVSYDEGSYNGTIRVRSSDVKPITLNEFYWTVNPIDQEIYVYKYNLDTGVGGDWSGLISILNYSDSSGTAVDRRTGHVAMSQKQYMIGKSGSTGSYVRIYDRNVNKLYEKFGVNYLQVFDCNMEFDRYGGVWGYSNSVEYLIHLDYQLVTTLSSINTGEDFLYDFAVELNGDGVWYTDKESDVVMHLDADGTTLSQIVLDTPRAICGTSDNGCWVIDNGDYYARRYAYNGSFVKSVYLDRTAVCMAPDYEDGFWYATTSYVYHINSVGTEVASGAVAGSSKLRSVRNGCVSWSSANDVVRYINANGVIVRTFTGPSSDTAFPGVFSHDYDDFVDYKTNALPASNDPVWGVDGSLDWKEVSKDGYFLYKKQYHQAELTLRSTESGVTPYVDRVVMSPAVQIQDIPPQSYKNIYTKTDIPAAAGPIDHEAKLKVWWGIEN